MKLTNTFKKAGLAAIFFLSAHVAQAGLPPPGSFTFGAEVLTGDYAGTMGMGYVCIKVAPREGRNPLFESPASRLEKNLDPPRPASCDIPAQTGYVLLKPLDITCKYGVDI